MKSTSYAAGRYDQLYKMADKVIKTHNPCKIHQDEHGRIRCATGSPCCGGCKHLGPTGCTVESLGCKLWLCHALHPTHEVAEASPVWIQLYRISQKAFNEGIPTGFRMSKEENFR